MKRFQIFLFVMVLVFVFDAEPQVTTVGESSEWEATGFNNGRRVVRERFAELLDDPLCARVRTHVEMKDLAPGMVDEDKDVEHPESRCGHGEEIHRCNAFTMVSQEYLPPLDGLRFGRPLWHVTRHRALGHGESEFLKFRMDTRGSPGQVFRSVG